ncbi:MAG TPA: aldo/keto reductase [Steroidobacteraceae bacterium]|nr:aldo/keto reductase [Steroidobacteraceae bacterium]
MSTPERLQFPARLGLGTWMMGESRVSRARELATLARALQLGYRVFDTAEIYGQGGAERLLGEALTAFGVGSAGAAAREELFLVSKVKPAHASLRGTVRACENSIERLRCRYLDLYLLHWPGPHPFDETLRALAELRERRLIRHFGVSNFTLQDLQRWREAEASLGLAGATQCNQLFYCLESRGIEFDLLPWQRQHAIFTMAYSPLGRGSLARHPLLERLGRARGASAAQIAIAWSMRTSDLISIPKSSDARRVEENWAAHTLVLSDAECAELDHAFPPPQASAPLATI